MPIYQGKCRNLTEEQKAELLASGRKPTVRFKKRRKINKLYFVDMVRGTVNFDSNGWEDFVIVKSDGIPVY